MRRVAKTVNFGVIYGLSAFGLAGRLGITQAEAAAFIEAYFQEYAGVDAFITRTLEDGPGRGPRRDDPGPPPADQRHQEHDRPEPQPGRADRHQHRDPGLGRRPDQAGDARRRPRSSATEGLQARMLLQIHDELVFEAPTRRSPRWPTLVREAMTTGARPERPPEGRPRRRAELARRRDRLSDGARSQSQPMPGTGG